VLWQASGQGPGSLIAEGCDGRDKPLRLPLAESRRIVMKRQFMRRYMA